MDRERLKKSLEGCYITVPTMFRDPDLELDTGAIRRHVKFLLSRGINAENAVLLAGGASLEEACKRFLSQPGAQMCYLLDRQGRQVVGNAFRGGLSHAELERQERFAPLHDTRHARWSRRPYFRNAEASPNFAQVTRPYMTLQGSRMCVTVSIQFDMGGRSLILCGDASL